jgi:FkbM family methyltransferase
MTKPAVLSRVLAVLAEADVTAVLVDVGASGGPPPAWSALAPLAHYIGFDPDAREMDESYGGEFRRSTVLAKAVTAEHGSTTTRFHLTRSPFCSSTLPPDLPALDDWTFRPLFDVVGDAEVEATTLDQVLDDAGAARLDWLKLDTQGTDLRIVESLGATRASSLVAVDIEPGLIDAYRGEDLFVAAHPVLVARGFWLAKLEVQGSTRASVDTVAALRASRPDLADWLVAHGAVSPGWCEARYLRTVDAVDWSTEASPLLLWATALLEGLPGAALDVAAAWRGRIGPSALADELFAVAVEAIVPSARERAVDTARTRAPEPLKRAVRAVRRAARRS